ncbi:MAG: TRAP transporter substrate-binding protein [Brevinemataceae bacterium]
MKKLAVLLLCSVVLSFSACGKKNSQASKNAGAQVLKLSHNHSPDFPVDLAYKKFASLVEEKSDGRFKIEIYPSAQLGNSLSALELVQTGVITFAHINSAALESFDKIYSVFNLPYIFRDYDHFRRVMDSEKVEEIFESTLDKGFRPILYLEGGARSFYTKSKPILKPADLKGLKIRVQESPTSIEMITLLGASPVVLSFGEVYTSIQQGVIDGAENNIPSIVQTGHAEVAKYISLTEHLRLSDILTVNSGFWQELNDTDKDMFRSAARETINYFTSVWDEAEKAALKAAVEKYNVKINSVDQTPFRTLVLPMHNKVGQQDPRAKELLDYIATN